MSDPRLVLVNRENDAFSHVDAWNACVLCVCDVRDRSRYLLTDVAKCYECGEQDLTQVRNTHSAHTLFTGNSLTRHVCCWKEWQHACGKESLVSIISIDPVTRCCYSYKLVPSTSTRRPICLKSSCFRSKGCHLANWQAAFSQSAAYTRTSGDSTITEADGSRIQHALQRRHTSGHLLLSAVRRKFWIMRELPTTP